MYWPEYKMSFFHEIGLDIYVLFPTSDILFEWEMCLLQRVLH